MTWCSKRKFYLIYKTIGYMPENLEVLVLNYSKYSIKIQRNSYLITVLKLFIQRIICFCKTRPPLLLFSNAATRILRKIRKWQQQHHAIFRRSMPVIPLYVARSIFHRPIDIFFGSRCHFSSILQSQSNTRFDLFGKFSVYGSIYFSFIVIKSFLRKGKSVLNYTISIVGFVWLIYKKDTLTFDWQH